MEFTKFRGLLTESINDADVILTGIPFDKNASIGKGASLAPDHIRELSKMIPNTSKEGFIINEVKLFDYGNITTENFEEIQEKSAEVLSNGKFSIFLGGDHSVAIATERAFYDYAKSLGKIPTIIHIDAHPDICDEYEDNKYSHACPNRRSLDYGYEESNLTIIGVRGYEPQETIFFENHPDVEAFTAGDVRFMRPEGIINYLKSKYDDSHLIYLSYDIDANDPAYAPGTGTPEPFGLTNFEVLEIVVGIIKELNVGCMDLVEVSPSLDINDITSYLAIKSIYEVLYTLQMKK